MRILIAEDEEDMNRLIKKSLEKEGYGVDACFDGKEALYYLKHTDYDAAILDIMMPEADGLTVLKAIRKKGLDLPVMFLTAKDSIPDRVLGLDSGADDYLIKPFDFDELLARVRSMTRKRTPHTSSAITIGDLTLDTGSHTVTRAGKTIDLSSREYSILEYMHESRHRLIKGKDRRSYMELRLQRRFQCCGRLYQLSQEKDRRRPVP